MTDKKLTNEQAIHVLDVLWYNPLFSEPHKQAFEIGIKAIKALEQETKYCDRNICLSNEYNGIGCDECEVAISKQAMFNILLKYKLDESRIAEELEELPPVTPQPKTGHWIKLEGSDPYYYMCSECHRRVDEKLAYCPSCWARMGGADDE